MRNYWLYHTSAKATHKEWLAGPLTISADKSLASNLRREDLELLLS